MKIRFAVVSLCLALLASVCLHSRDARAFRVTSTGGPTLPVSTLNGGTGAALTPGVNCVPMATSGTTFACNVPQSGTGLTFTSPGSAIQYALNIPVATANGGTGQTTGATSAWSGISASVPASNTNFIAFGENASQAIIATESLAQNVEPFAATANNLFCKQASPAGANGPAYTVNKNGVNTTLTCTVANLATTCTSTASFTLVAGDLLDISVVNGFSGATGIFSCGFTLNG